MHFYNYLLLFWIIKLSFIENKINTKKGRQEILRKEESGGKKKSKKIRGWKQVINAVKQ